MNPTLNGSSVIWHFKRSNAIEIRDGITFDFYMGLPHTQIYYARQFILDAAEGKQSNEVYHIYTASRQCIQFIPHWDSELYPNFV